MSEIFIPPHSIEAEQAVLGGLMLDNSCFDDIFAKLVASDFYNAEHRVIYSAICELARAEAPFDVVTLVDKITSTKMLKNNNILSYVAELARNTPSTANIIAYTDVVKERSKLRQFIQFGNEMTREASKKDITSQQLIEQTDKKLYQLSQDHGDKEFVDLFGCLNEIVDKIDTHFNSGDPITGLTSGLEDLDNYTAGFQPADLIILGGRPSMGKTSLALDFVRAALDASSNQEKTVQIYSLEMPAEALLQRMISQISGIDLGRIKSGQIHDDNGGINEWNSLTVAMAKLQGYAKTNRLIINDSSDLSSSAIRAKARKSARMHGNPCLIAIDYLQLIASQGRYESRNLEVGAISKDIKALAKELNCPVILLSQLNRSLEQRPNKRPFNADLRDSGAIEQDADLIMFVYRDEVYHPESIDAGIAEIIISKQRNGPTGTVKVAFDGKQTNFKSLKGGY